MASSPITCFFEIPVYRCSPEAYEAEIQKAQETRLKELSDLIQEGGDIRRTAPDTAPRVYERIRNKHGGPWQFNQIMGWVRLYMLGTQVRGEGWLLDAKRITRTLKPKIFRWEGTAFERSIFPEQSNLDIYSLVLAELERLPQGMLLKSRHIDLEAFKIIGPTLDWRGLLKAYGGF